MTMTFFMAGSVGRESPATRTNRRDRSQKTFDRTTTGAARPHNG